MYICELSGIIGKGTYIDNLLIVPLFLKTNKSWTVRPTQRSWTSQKSPSHLFHCRNLSKTVRGGAIWLKQVEILYSEVSTFGRLRQDDADHHKSVLRFQG